MIDPKFIHLRLHSAYSLAEGAIKTDKLMGLCIKNNMPAIAVTDTNNLFGSMDLSFQGKEIATITSSSPKGKSLITTDLYYDVTCEEKDLDLIFLVAFSIAKTDQIFYN